MHTQLTMQVVSVGQLFQHSEQPSACESRLFVRMQSGTRPQNQAHRRSTMFMNFLLLAVCRPIVYCDCLDVLIDVCICVVIWSSTVLLW